MKKLRFHLILLIILSSSALTAQLSIKDALKSLTEPKGYDDFFPEKTEFGFVPIGQKGSKYFYWMAPSRSNPDTDPLVFWFQGGPGTSSLYGLFFEQGPFSIKNKGDLKATLRPLAWNQKANIVFLEFPLGVGFSEAAEGEEPQTREEVQKNILEFFKNWLGLEKFQKFKGRPLFITGESYGGHWVPYIANALYKENNPDINIKGLAIGNGWIKPTEFYLTFPDFGLMHTEQTSMTQETYAKLKPIGELCHHILYRQSPFLTYPRGKLCDDRVEGAIEVDPVTHKQRFNIYNFHLKNDYPDYYTDFVNNPGVQKVLGVNKKWSDSSDIVYQNFYREDYFLDASPDLRELMEDDEFKVLFYNGDYDFTCNWFGEEASLEQIQWKRQGEWKKVEWEDCAYGQCKSLGNVKFVKFHAAGHMVPHDQIKLSIDMLDELTGVNK